MKKLHMLFTALTLVTAFSCFYFTLFVFSHKNIKSIVPPRTMMKNAISLTVSKNTSKQATTADPKFSNISLKIDGKIHNLVYKVFEPLHGGNDALIIDQRCHHPATEQNASKVVLITGFVDFARNSIYRKTLQKLGDLSDSPENRIIEAREMEIINVLQVNLLHPMLESIHVLAWSRSTAEYLKSLNLKNSEKLILRVVGRDVGLKEQLLYASECLAGRVVAITNHDNTIGKGWDNKDYIKILKEKDIMYALTRHSTLTEKPEQGSGCMWTQGKGNNCDIGGSYSGSHDTFILHAKKWNSNVLTDLNNVTPDKPGMENLFLWFFNTKMHYTILNPCQVLFVHHHHCVPLRGANRPRINVGGKSFTIGFSDKLQ